MYSTGENEKTLLKERERECVDVIARRSWWSGRKY